MSRDDSGSFLPHYQELEIVKKNPFASIDQTGVGQLMQIAVEKGRKTRPDIKLGICGEHGGDPDSREVLPSHRPDLRELLARSACRSRAWPRRKPRLEEKPKGEEEITCPIRTNEIARRTHVGLFFWYKNLPKL